MALIEPDARPGACVACRGRCAMVTACGIFLHVRCAMILVPELPMAAMAPAAVRRQPIAGADGKPKTVWVGAEARKAAASRSPERVGPIQPALRSHLLEAGLDPALVLRAVALWNDTMRGIRFDGPHRTALNILNGTMKHAKIPELPPLPDGCLDRLKDAPVWNFRSWLTHSLNGAGREGASVLAAFDVNGSYLGAAEIELGVGEPVWSEWPQDAVLSLPGYVRTSSLEGAPWSILDRWKEGMWLPTPLAAYLRDVGAQFLITEALVWPEHRRWLRPHAGLLREARRMLMMDGSPAALAVLDVTKEITTRILGGLLGSKDHNDTATLQPAARSQVIGTAQARFFRALDATQVLPGVGVAGWNVDAAWFVMPAGYRTPPGLAVSDHRGPCLTKECHQLGKFKPAGRVAWTPELEAAWQDGQHKTLWRALGGRD